MQVGMTMPVMEPGLDAGLLEKWAREIDHGPFSSLCFGERIAFDNPETLTLLGAVAAWTSRVRLVTTVVVPQLHDPVMLAKALATADVISDGRLTVGVGVGGREEDYRAVGADLSTQTIAGMADRVSVMREVWSGRHSLDAVRPVGPRPVQRGGPQVLVGTMGHRTTQHAASWADGLAGVTLDLDTAAASKLFELARTSWAAAGRDTPWLTTSFWFALGERDAAREQVHRHLRHYMNWLPVEVVDALAPGTGFAGSADSLVEVLSGFAAIGADEVHLIPTSSDPTQLALAAEVVERFSLSVREN
jgi:alkanesulfonate monooxygenase SsuD/methylene tetrahydromethanopterin reductase-like flavin-dependent oxidoreductase (luciferase family)